MNVQEACKQATVILADNDGKLTGKGGVQISPISIRPFVLDCMDDVQKQGFHLSSPDDECWVAEKILSLAENVMSALKANRSDDEIKNYCINFRYHLLAEAGEDRQEREKNLARLREEFFKQD